MGLKAIGQSVGSMVKGFASAGAGAIENVIHSQYKEYIVSGDMTNVLMKRGEFVMNEDGRNKASKRNDKNIITNGSRIDVQRNQAMIIVDSGKVVEYCDVEGQYIYDTSSAPSVFSSSQSLGANLKSVVLEAWNQTTAGGTRVSTQRVYFISKGPIVPELKWGFGDASFRHSICTPGLPPFQQTIKVRANGKAQFAITNPLTFFNNYGCRKIGGDNDGLYTIDEAFEDGGPFALIKPSINQAISSSLSKLGSQQALMYDEIPQHTEDMCNIITEKNGAKWEELFGINVIMIVFNGAPTPYDEDIEKIQKLVERAAMSSNANMMNFEIQKDMAAAMKAAGENGGVTGLYGMGMTMGMMGGTGMGNMQNQQIPNMQQPMGGYYQQPQQPMQQQPVQQQAPVAPTPVPAPTAPTADSWNCGCGTENTGKFCVNCGAKKPSNENPAPAPASTSWNCSCGQNNSGKFCMNCGSPKPVIKKYQCDKCGWKPADETKPPKFCPECGDMFNDEDLA